MLPEDRLYCAACAVSKAKRELEKAEAELQTAVLIAEHHLRQKEKTNVP